MWKKVETIEERSATKCEMVGHIWIGGLACELSGVETVNNVFFVVCKRCVQGDLKKQYGFEIKKKRKKERQWSKDSQHE